MYYCLLNMISVSIAATTHLHHGIRVRESGRGSVRLQPPARSRAGERGSHPENVHEPHL